MKNIFLTRTICLVHGNNINVYVHVGTLDIEGREPIYLIANINGAGSKPHVELYTAYQFTKMIEQRAKGRSVAFEHIPLSMQRVKRHMDSLSHLVADEDVAVTPYVRHNVDRALYPLRGERRKFKYNPHFLKVAEA